MLYHISGELSGGLITSCIFIRQHANTFSVCRGSPTQRTTLSMLHALFRVRNNGYTSMPNSEKNTFPPTSTIRLLNTGLPARISSLKPPPCLPLLRSIHVKVLSRVQDNETPLPSVRLANSIFSERTKKADMLVHVVEINSAWRVFPAT